jgi:hypothetical protein
MEVKEFVAGTKGDGDVPVLPSSDGMGGAGTFGDCGYQDPVIAPQYVGEVE